MSTADHIAELCLRTMSRDDLDALQGLVERCRDFYLLATRRAPDLGTASRIWAAGAPGVTRDDKLALGLFDDDGAGPLRGFIDVIPGWPGADVWTIALILVDPDDRRRGAGSRLLAAADAAAADAGARTLRAQILPHNAMSLAFSERHGFARVPTPGTGVIAVERAIRR